MQKRRMVAIAFVAIIASGVAVGLRAAPGPATVGRHGEALLARSASVAETNSELRVPATGVAASPDQAAKCADVNSSGTITSADIISLVNYVFKGAAAPSCPGCTFSWGTIAADGSILNAGSGDWTCVWQVYPKRYEITIAGEDYTDTKYHTSITPLGDIAPRFAATSSFGGILFVYLWDAAGVKGQNAFTFTVTKF